MTDVHIKDAQVVTASGIQHGEIAISDGTIDAAGPASSVPTPSDPDTVIDADGMVALPGAIDVHTHMHDDELFPDGIDFASQTASAVAGGVTTVIELPTQTPVTTPEAMQEKAAACSALAHVDFGLVAGNIQEPDIDVAGIMDAGTADFKTFTADPYLAGDASIARLMRRVGDAGGTVRVHCETQGLLDDARSAIDGDEPEVYMDSRPLEAELDAISRAATSRSTPTVRCTSSTSPAGAARGRATASNRERTFRSRSKPVRSISPSRRETLLNTGRS